jgi:Fe-S cluster assembly protein SufB
VAVDAVFDSVSVATTFKKKLGEAGVIFCPISEAIREHPELVKKYLGTVVPVSDNFFATLNSAVFSDGSFVYVPKGVRCPMELSTYFRINASETGQFERTLIIADEGAYVSYLEGCTAPKRDENQLHAAVVELVALDGAEIKYSTVQNWYPGDEEGQGRHLQFRHQARRLPRPRFQDFLDAGGDRLRHHLEISQLHPARRQFRGRVLFHRHRQQLSSRPIPARR